MKHFLNQRTNDKTYVSSTGSAGAGYLPDIIREIGLSLSKSQEILDENWIEAQRERLIQLLVNPDLLIPQASSFVLPEASLDLNMQIKGKYDKSGNFKIETKPHNSETLSSSKVNQNISSKVSLKFVMVPEEESTTNGQNSNSKLDADDVLELARLEIIENNELTSGINIEYTHLTMDYISESRKWHITAFDTDEAFALLIFDDTTSNIIKPILFFSANHRTIENTNVLTSPSISSLRVANAPERTVTDGVSSGDIIEILGENLGALNIDETIVKVNGIKVTPQDVSFESIKFKITPQITSGLIEVQTPEGTSKFSEHLLVKATFIRFEQDSEYGFYNPENKIGSLIKVHGENISNTSKLEFSNGALASVERHTATSAHFRVPEDAKSGPLGFKEGAGVSMQSFFLRPFIKDVDPKEARFGELVRITGNHFNNIQKVRIGEKIYELSSEASERNKVRVIKSDQSLLFEVPGGAGDGRISVQSHQRWWDTSVFFYQVPLISQTPDYIIVDETVEVHGFGYGTTHHGLNLEFDIDGSKSGRVSECTFINNSPDNVGQIAAFKIVDDYVTGKIRIIRSDIAEENNYEATTALSKRKVPVFKKGTLRNHILWSSPSWTNHEDYWSFQNIEFLSRGVLKTRKKDNELFLKTEIPTYISLHGEFHNIKELEINLSSFQQEPQPPGENSVALTDMGRVSILILPKEITIKLFNSEINEPVRVAKIPLSFKEDIFENLLLNIGLTHNEFTAVVNDFDLAIDLSDPGDNNRTEVADILNEHHARTQVSALSFNTNADAYISSIVVSEHPTLLIPSFDNYIWDFTLKELSEDIKQYQLDELHEFPSIGSLSFKIRGSGFSDFTTVVINGQHCLTDVLSEFELEVSLTPEISNGELFAVDYLDSNIRSNSISFKILQSGKIHSISNTSVSSGDVIKIQGEHLTDNGIPEVYIEKFGPLDWTQITNELIEVKAPKITLLGGHIRLVYQDKSSVTSDHLLSVSSHNKYDFLNRAHHARWIVPNNINDPWVLNFGSTADISSNLGAVIMKNNVLLDNEETYDQALILTCPGSENNYLEGRFEDFYIPKGAELNFNFSFLKESTLTDGVYFSVILELETEIISIVNPVKVEYGDSILDYSYIANDTQPKGTLVIRVNPGTSGYDDNLALVKAEMKFTNVENGWTWLFGSNKTNIPTIPGIRTISDLNNMPGARSFASVWQDNQGHIWVYGGYGNDINPRTGRLNDLWRFDGENWTWMDGMVGKNGFSQFGEIPGEAVTPGGRYASAYWQDNNGTFWLFGGHGYHESGRQRCLNDLWRMVDREWEMIAISANWIENGAHGQYGTEGPMFNAQRDTFSAKYWPLTRSHSAFWYDETSELLWLFGGEYYEPNDEYLISDLWSFDGNEWNLRSGDPSRNFEDNLNNSRPSARKGATIWTESQNLWLFGGYGYLNEREIALNDLWLFKTSEDKWILMDQTIPPINSNFIYEHKRPGPRAFTAIWKDNSGVVWLFGGEGSNVSFGKSAPLNDLWKFTNGNWIYIKGPIKERDMGNLSEPKIPYPDSWPSSRYGASTWISPAGWLMMYGGKGYGENQKSGNKSQGQLQQLWQFSPRIEE